MTDPTAALRQQLAGDTSNGDTERRGPTIDAYIRTRAAEIDAVLPDGWDHGRLQAIAQAACAEDVMLTACTAESFLGALLRCAQLNMEPGPLGRCFISRRQTTAKFILGYKGILDLARRSGEVETIEAHAVYGQELFEVEYGTNRRLVHRPDTRGRQGDAHTFYVYVRLTNGGEIFDFLTRDEIDDRRQRGEADPTGGPWSTDYDAMARKTCIRYVEPYLPLDTTAANAFAHDGATFVGLDPTPHEDDPIAPAPEPSGVTAPAPLEASTGEAPEGAPPAELAPPVETGDGPGPAPQPDATPGQADGDGSGTSTVETGDDGDPVDVGSFVKKSAPRKRGPKS